MRFSRNWRQHAVGTATRDRWGNVQESKGENNDLYRSRVLTNAPICLFLHTDLLRKRTGINFVGAVPTVEYSCSNLRHQTQCTRQGSIQRE